MTDREAFESWWKQTKPAEVDVLKVHFEDCWKAATERAAKICEEHNPGGSYHIRTELAAAIRNRGTT